ncbi:MAG TPA: aminomethyl-transferring glycine dehydrogenase, partial [Synergistaceae bacterium]|nr:aminomethyl-transferring glycine dehydrogenase [Synergistaceae bacterium]
EVAGLYVENPNFLGYLEVEASTMAELLHASGALFIVGTDPSSLGALTPPGRYGADIVCGDIQPLGMHMYAGGARAGFIATRDEERFVQQFPSRLFGIAPTTHKEWGFGDVAWERTSFAKREEAVEFVGTASALWGITAGVYLALMGPQGMKELGEGIFQRSAYLAEKMAELPGVKVLFRDTPFFKEFGVNFEGTGKTVKAVNEALLEKGVFGCLDLSEDFPSLGQTGLFCVTEVHSQEDMDILVRLLKEILG